jgi:hypothetical protein
MAGRPPGTENKNKRFRAALNRYADADPKRLDDLAEKLWATAMSGDTQAIREVADRLDGKVPQALVGDDEHPPIGVTQIERKIVDTADPNGAGVPAVAGPSEV